MLMTTTSTLQGKTIHEYIGVVSAETIIGANIVKDFFASITDILGGRSSSYEKVLKKAKLAALEELKVEGQKVGANAIIAIDLDYETVGKGMLMVVASGTAITYRD